MKNCLKILLFTMVVAGILISPLNTYAQEVPQNLDFRYSISNAYPNLGDKVYFLIQGVAGGSAPYRYQWKINDKVISKTKKAEFTFEKPGEYLMEITVTDRLGAKKTQKRKIVIKEVKVEPKPTKKPKPKKTVQPLKCEIDGYITTMPGYSLKWKAKVQGGEGPYRYAWRLSSFGVISQTISATHYFPDPARYYLTLIVWDSKNRTTENRVLVVVKNKDGSWPGTEVQPQQ